MKAGPLTIALFAAYTVLSVAGLVMLRQWMPVAQALWTKGSFASAASAWVALGAVLYIASFLAWVAILGRVPLTIAYPVAIGLTMAFSTVCAVVILHESLGALRLVGMALVFLGIVLIAGSGR